MFVRNPSPAPAPASQDPRMPGPRPARRDPGLIAQHVLICREAAPLSRSLLSKTTGDHLQCARQPRRHPSRHTLSSLSRKTKLGGVAFRENEVSSNKRLRRWGWGIPLGKRSLLDWPYAARNSSRCQEPQPRGLQSSMADQRPFGVRPVRNYLMHKLFVVPTRAWLLEICVHAQPISLVNVTLFARSAQ